MTQCLFTSNAAKSAQYDIEHYLEKEPKIARIDNDKLVDLCNDLVQDFHTKVLDYNNSEKIMTIFVSGQIKKQLYNQLMKINKYREHYLDEIQFLIDFCNRNGYLSGVNALIKDVNNNKFKIQFKRELPKNLFDLSESYYQHHYWHLSRKTSLKIYFDFIDFISTLSDKIKPFNKINYLKLNEFLKHTIPDLFILVGEIDLNYSDSNDLPIIIQDKQFQNDTPDKYYNRILDNGNDEYWSLTNSSTELNSFIKFNYDNNLKLNSFPKLFELEFLRNIKFGIPDFHCRKYENSDILLIQIKDKEYQFELIKDDISKYKKIYDVIIDYE